MRSGGAASDCRVPETLILAQTMENNSVIDGLCFCGRVRARTSLAYLPVHDHKRLPGRFFARLTGADGSVAAR
jgi:hypothetical protein